MGRSARVAILVVIAIAAGVALLVHAPIPQPDAYHAFGDTRTIGGIPNALNVLSNIPFFFVGVLGLYFLVNPGTAFESLRERPAYVLFFAGVLLTAFGSSYYHWQPTTQRLFWDRFPMAIAFTALFASVIAERIDVYWSRILLLPFVFLGVGSVVAWRISEDQGAGDLRAYVFVQGFPMIALPLLMAMFRARYTRSAWLLVVVLFYVAAKALEQLDVQIYSALGGAVSGHSLKHLAAAAATYAVLVMLKRRKPLASEVHSAA